MGDYDRQHYKKILQSIPAVLAFGDKIKRENRIWTVEKQSLNTIYKTACENSDASLQELQLLCADYQKTLHHVSDALAQTLLHQATANHGHEAIAQLLINAGADINAKDSDGCTPLILAAWEFNIATAELLLKNDASINEVNNYGTTCLSSVSSWSHVPFMQLLLKYRADPVKVNERGQTPLLASIVNTRVRMEHKIAAVKILLEYEQVLQEIDHKDNNGGTALSIAKERNYTDIVKLITEAQEQIALFGDIKNAAVCATPSFDLSVPVWKAVVQYDDALFNELLDKKKDINQPNPFGDTPLHIAAIQGGTVIAVALIEAGAHVNLLNEDENTPLHMAASNGHLTVATVLLVKSKEALEMKNIAGKKPIDLAQENGHTKMVEILTTPPQIFSLDATQYSYFPSSCRGRIDATPLQVPLMEPLRMSKSFHTS